MFTAGKLLGPYEILEPIGAGGMGEVYRARDHRLERDVAIKVVRADLVEDAQRLRRFQQEAKAAAAFHHPNICILHEIGESEGHHFIVMEYVEGRPLSRLMDGRPVPAAQILDLAIQMSEALAEARSKGVVHRDIKPSNILVTSKGQAKILDFGLAKHVLAPQTGADNATITEPMTQAGMVVGTIPYMSPEQALGQPADHRSDLFSLGIVLYEMATGRRPFQGGTPMALMNEIINKTPAPAVTLNSTLPVALETVLRKTLEKDRERRYQTAEDLLADLQRLRRNAEPAQGATTVVANPPLDRVAMDVRKGRFGGRHGVWVGLSLIVISVVAFATFWAKGMDSFRAAAARILSPGSGVNPRRSVAVLGFKNISGNIQVNWLSTALSEMLATELSAGEKLRTIPGETVARVKLDLALAEAESFEKNTLARIRAYSGTDLVVLGSYAVLGKPGEAQIRLDLRLQDAIAGETIAAISETDAEANLLTLVTRTGARLREKLGVEGISASATAGVRASLPPSAEAARLYGEGLNRLRLFDAQGARDFLTQASATSPEYPHVHSALAAAWSALGYDGRAVDEAKKAFDLSSNLPREDRLFIEGRYLEMKNEWDKAVKIYRSLFDFFPDNVEYGLRLASALTSAGQGKTALDTIEKLRSLTKPTSDDPRIDLAEALADGSLSDFKRERALLVRVAEKGHASGAKLLVARARLLETRALRNLGQLGESRAAAEEARRLFAAAGYQEGLARSLNNLWASLFDQGDLRGSLLLIEEALAISRKIGDKRGVANALNNMAIQFKDTGDLTQALKMHHESLAIRREIDDKSGVAVSLNNIGVILYGQADLRGAKRNYEESIAICRAIGERRCIVRAQHNLALALTDEGEMAAAERLYEESLRIRKEIGDKRGIALMQLGLGDTLRLQGKLPDARALFETSLKSDREANDKRGAAYNLYYLGEVSMAQGDLNGARRNLEEALSIREQMGEKDTAEEARVGLAELAVAEGRFSEAITLAGKSARDVAWANVILARALLAQGNFTEARKRIDRAQTISGKSEQRFLTLSIGLTAARIEAARGRSVEAQRQLERVLAEAVKTGYLELQLEARLALIEIGRKSGNDLAVHARLAALQRDAESKGFGLIARKAAHFATGTTR